MLFSTIGQIHIFLWMVGAGLGIGALYALCSALRRLLQAGFLLTLAADILFGLLSAVILTAAALTADYGSIRLYELLGAALGAALFRLGIQPPLEMLGCAVIQRMHAALKRLANFRPIKVIFK